MEFIHITMETTILVLDFTIKKMVMGSMNIFIKVFVLKETGKMAKNKVKGKCCLKMELFMKVNEKEDFQMDKAK